MAGKWAVGRAPAICTNGEIMEALHTKWKSLPDSKLRLIGYLERDGYELFQNTYRLTPKAKQWQGYDVVCVATSQTAPQYLWAVKPN